MLKVKLVVCGLAIAILALSGCASSAGKTAQSVSKCDKYSKAVDRIEWEAVQTEIYIDETDTWIRKLTGASSTARDLKHFLKGCLSQDGEDYLDFYACTRDAGLQMSGVTRYWPVYQSALRKLGCIA